MSAGRTYDLLCRMFNDSPTVDSVLDNMVMRQTWDRNLSKLQSPECLYLWCSKGWDFKKIGEYYSIKSSEVRKYVMDDIALLDNALNGSGK